MTPTVTLMAGDNRLSLAALPENSVDAVETDSPYGFVSMRARFSKRGSKPAGVEGTDGSFARVGKGFLGREWDGSGIEQDAAFWAAVMSVLRSGV